MAAELNELARRMLADYDARTPGEQFGETNALTAARAYALQAEIAWLRERRGERVIGYKIGCTSRIMQAQLGVAEPIFGRLFDTGCHPSGARVDSARYANLAIEGELAIRLSRDVPAGSAPGEEYNAAVESVLPVIELHHHVLPASGPVLSALIASGGMHAGLVLPARETACADGVPAIAGLEVAIDDRIAGMTREPWTMGGPAATLRWLSARLAEWGLQLARGQLILTGSALPLFPVKAGSRVTAEARPLGMSFVEID